jgi:hypothetical protein
MFLSCILSVYLEWLCLVFFIGCSKCTGLSSCALSCVSVDACICLGCVLRYKFLSSQSRHNERNSVNSGTREHCSRKKRVTHARGFIHQFHAFGDSRAHFSTFRWEAMTLGLLQTRSRKWSNSGASRLTRCKKNLTELSLRTHPTPGSRS